jgi:Kef-type K+ transport system membrane component KefB
MVIQRLSGVSDIPGLIPTTIVSLVLFFAWLAHVVGAPELLGGFAAGLALSRRFFLPFGIAMTPRGEVGLVFAEIGRVGGILDNQLYTSLIIAIALTTLVTPFALKWFYDRYGAELPANEPA